MPATMYFCAGNMSSSESSELKPLSSLESLSYDAPLACTDCGGAGALVPMQMVFVARPVVRKARWVAKQAEGARPRPAIPWAQTQLAAPQPPPLWL